MLSLGVSVTSRAVHGGSAPPTEAPASVAAPVISGTPEVDRTLTVSNGSWTQSPTAFSYAWTVDGVAAGTDAPTFSTAGLSIGDVIGCAVTATNAIGSGTPEAAATVTLLASAPAAPTGFTATGGAGEIVFAWTNGDDGGATITATEIESAADGAVVATLTGTGTTVTLDGLSAGRASDSFRARHVNARGNGAWSAADTAAATALPPVNDTPAAITLDGAFEAGETVSYTAGSWTGATGGVTAVIGAGGATVSAGSGVYTITAADVTAGSITLTETATRTAVAGVADATATQDSNSLEAVTFVPTDLSGLVAWYDAADASTIIETGGAVSQWNDKSGGNRHAAQGNATRQPTTGSRSIGGVNALNALNFDNGDVLVAAHSYDYTAGQTVFAVFLTDGEQLDERVVSQTIDGDDADFRDGALVPIIRDGATTGIGTLRDRAGSVGVLGYGAAETVTTGSAVIFAHVNDETDFVNRAGGGAGTTETGEAFSPGVRDDILIGGLRTSVDGNFDGLIGEVIIYDRALSLSEINQVGDYLADKWSLTWSAAT